MNPTTTKPGAISPRDLRPVYLVNDATEDSWIFVGWVDQDSVESLYKRCEHEFDWMCGFEDSGFDQPQILVYCDNDWAGAAHMGMRLRTFVEDLWSFRPGRSRLPVPYSFWAYDIRR